MSTQNQIPKNLLEALPEFDQEKFEYKWGQFEVPTQPGTERWDARHLKWVNATPTGFPLFRRPIRWELVMNRKDWQDGDQWCFLTDWQRHNTEWCTDRPLPHILSGDIIIRRRIR